MAAEQGSAGVAPGAGHAGPAAGVPAQAGRGRLLASWGWVVLVAGGLLGVALAGEVGPATMLRWYLSLDRPWWQPPDWVVPLVWTAIYAVLAWAARRAWRAAPDAAARRGIVRALAVNLGLNALWALLFFVHRRPDWALWETLPLWLSVAWVAWVLGRHDRAAGWSQLPYLAWVSFAAVLNLALVRLNAPFP